MDQWVKLQQHYLAPFKERKQTVTGGTGCEIDIPHVQGQAM